MRALSLLPALAMLLAGCPRPPVEAPALIVEDVPLPEGYRGEAYSFEWTATGGTPPYTWIREGSSLPPGLTLRANGTLDGTPTAAAVFQPAVKVVDSAGASVTTSRELTIHEPLGFAPSALPEAPVGHHYQHTVEVTGGKPPITLSQSGALPSGLSWSGAALTGTPTETGEFPLTFSATDANGRSATLPLTLVVREALLLQAVSSAEGYVGEAYEFSFVTSGGQAPYTYAVASGVLPGGLTLGAAGQLAGTPTVAGSFTFEVRVTDTTGLAASVAVDFTVYAPLQILSGAPADGYLGIAYEAQLAAAGGKAPLTWAPLGGSFPTGMTFSSDGAITGTPTSPGSSSLLLQVQDANGRAASQTVPFHVYAPPQLTTASLADGTLGQPYLQQLSSVGGKGERRYQHTQGTLPPGLTLNGATGALSGTPTTAGPFTFTLTVFDENDQPGPRSYTVTIAPAGGPAVLEVASWNIEWFGSTGNGPSDEVLQQQNATAVLTAGGFDVVGVAEIVSTTAFNTLVAGVPGRAGFLANDASVTGGSGSYGSSEQKVGFIYDTSKVEVLSSQIILSGYDYEFAGRPPLRVDTRVEIEGTQTSITFIMVHLKAADDTGSRDRRAASAAALKGYLDTLLASAHVLVIGDFNDDVDESISCPGIPCLDTPFRNFLDDASDYRFITAPLSAQGLSSTVFYDQTIDHHLATNEMSALAIGAPEVVRPDLWPVPVSGYGTTTSDHYPILTRYDLSGGGGGTGSSPAVFLNEVLFDEPGTNYAAEFVEVRNAGPGTADLSGWTLSDDLQLRHQFPFGTTLAEGEVIVVFGGASAIGGAPHAVAASTGQLSFHPTDSVSLRDAVGAPVDSLTWDAASTFGDGVSWNRSPDGSAAGTWAAHDVLGSGLSSPGRRASGADW